MSFIPLSELKTSAANKSPAIDLQPSALSSPHTLTPHPSPFTSSQRLPPWFKVQAKTGPDYLDIKQTMDRLKLHTICEEARCPNRWECWNARTATFLILGDICTRRCHYCSVETGRPLAVDHEEPRRVAEAIQALGLRHAVITSVNRDELEDGGAAIFAETIRQTRQLSPGCTIEVLIPDFEGNHEALAMVCAEKPEILNHNIETVRRLFPAIRPQGKYQRSIELLGMAKQWGMRTKSGLILGMGETMDEARAVMRDLRSVGCDIMTIGQYLQPTRDHLPVARFYDPSEFALLKEEGRALGFTHVESGPLVRSSYHAEQQVAPAGDMPTAMSHHNVVIISAHPDDMEIGMGGTAAKLAESMAVITSVVITNGGRSSNPFALTEQRLAEVRREEALHAAGVLGVKDVIFFDEPDAADEIDIPAVAQRLVEILARLQPTEVYTLDEEGDRHPAHRLAGKLARESVLAADIEVSGGIWAYEIWGPFAAWDRLEYIDRYVAKKMAAIAEHHSQVATIPYGEGVLGLNRWRAVFADPKASAPAGEYAEVFRRITLSPHSK